MRRAEISFELEPNVRKIVIESLSPELGRTVPKTQVNISETNAGLKIIFDAETTSALRAALNSYLRWLNCILSIVEKFNTSSN